MRSGSGGECDVTDRRSEDHLTDGGSGGGPLVRATPGGHVLVAGESPRLDEVVAALESAIGSDAVEQVASVEDASERIESTNCVVVPAAELGSITSLRRRAGILPILAVVDGEGAREAVQSGATDVLRPSDPSDVVAARTRNAIERSRAETGLDGPLLERSDATILTTDERGRIRGATPGVERRIGLTPAELAGVDLDDLVHPDDEPSVRAAIDAVDRAGLDARERTTCRLRHADGSWRVTRLLIRNAVTDPSVAGLVVTVEPSASAAPSVERALDRFRTPVVSLDADWAVTAANEAARELFAPDRELAGTVFWNLLPDAVVGEWYERFGEADATDGVVAFVPDHDPFDGEYRCAVHPDPDGDGVTIVVQEDHRDREAAIERDRALESLVDELGDAVFVLDDGTVTLANAALFDLTGDRTVVGRDLSELLGGRVADQVTERAGDSVRRTEPIVAEVDVDEGRSRDVRISVIPLPDGRAGCILRDVTDRLRLADGIESIADLADEIAVAEATVDVGRRVAETARDALSADATGLYRVDGDANGTVELRPVAIAAGPDSRSVPWLERVGAGSDGEWDAPRSEAVIDQLLSVVDDGRGAFLEGVARERDDPQRPREMAPREERGGSLAVPVGTDRVLVAVARDRPFGREDLDLCTAVGSVGGVGLEWLRDRTTLDDHRREVDRVRQQVDAVATLLDRRLAIEETVRNSRSRERLESTVCEHLELMEAVDLAVIGEPIGSDERGGLSATAASPPEPGELADLLDGGAAADEPGALAARHGETVAVDGLARASTDSPWRRDAVDRGLQSVIAVPIEAREIRYGALVVYGRRPSGFDERFVAVLEDVGATIGYARSTLETWRSVLADRSVELEIAVRDGDPLTEAAVGADCVLDLEAVLDRGDGRWTIYLAAEGVEPERVRDALSDVTSVSSARVRTSTDGGPSRFTAVVEGESIASVAAEHGGVVRRALPDGTGRLTVELPVEADVRAFVDRLNRTTDGVELRSRRQLDRPVRRGTETACRAALESRLTDRQREVLRGAYYGGFFEWPREQTGEEIAAELGISQPTFTRHFRAAERAIFSLFFDPE